MRNASATTVSGRVPTTRLVPWLTVTGRSVFWRSVRHGTPSIVVSSWMPPESVSTRRARLIRATKSRYPSGGRQTSPRVAPASVASAPSRARTRGWTGKTIGSRRPIVRSAPSSSSSTSGSSTLAGRCRVRTANGRPVRRSRSTIVEALQRIRDASRASAMTLPTKWIFSGAAPSRRRLARAPSSVMNRTSATASVSTRLISSGIVRSKLRRPASTWTTGMPSFTAVRVAASVEFTSPTTSTASGRDAVSTGSRRRITSAVCTA